ncbi:MbtH family protein [Kitasatospora sp. NBC_01266]|uniref:MbtH family protein n=1 Tax=Kitasatospora sp. NBC_01266 TaxID=2903572 RepID=UPI002E2FFE1B|nr:MbtH family NRPS accessory protein [Kitasatospora sp. NBC_01266]
MNPFDDPEASYVVLVNEEGQFSLWPEFAGIPDGWRIARPAAARTTCIEFINENWTDMRPASLVRESETTAS